MIDVTIWCIDTAITELWEAYKLIITNISRMTIKKKKKNSTRVDLLQFPVRNKNRSINALFATERLFIGLYIIF